MSQLQLNELKLNNTIDPIAQAKIYGNGAGPHLYIAPSAEKQEELWEDYIDGDLYIQVVDRWKNSSGTFLKFYREGSRNSLAGVIKA